MNHTHGWLRFVIAAIIALTTILTTMPASAQTGERCFAETGQCISGRFREYWEANGGLPVFGYPISAAQPEFNSDAGEMILTQHFERTRFELHPANIPPYDVLLGRLGDDLLRLNGIDWQNEPKGEQTPDCLWFAATEHSVCDQADGVGFKTYWQRHGLQFDGQPGVSYAESLALFGLPLTEPRTETNSSGDTVITQHFERARFEWHPNQPDAYTVLLGRLGAEARKLFTTRANPGLPGQLIVRSFDIYSVAADGSRSTRLALTDSVSDLAFTQDGTRVALRCTANGGTGLCVANRDGSNLVRIGTDADIYLGSWSPDGTRVAYTSTANNERRGLRVINADGTGDTLLMAGDLGLMQRNPTWSPDGKQLAFNTIFSEQAIYVVNADGTGLRRIVAAGDNPHWSPDGARIAFDSAAAGTPDIYTVNPDGSGLTQLTSGNSADSAPRWSPDGTRIAYRWAGETEPSPGGPPTGIYVIGANGGTPVAALHTEPAYRYANVVWSPDGAYVASSRFCSRACGPTQIMAARADGSAQFLLVESVQVGGPAGLIDWLP